MLNKYTKKVKKKKIIDLKHLKCFVYKYNL